MSLIMYHLSDELSSTSGYSMRDEPRNNPHLIQKQCKESLLVNKASKFDFYD